MRRLAASFAVTTLMAAFALNAETARKAAPDPPAEEIERIVRAVADNETAFAKARESYTYTQSVRLQDFDEGGMPGGKFELVTEIYFDAKGNRKERVVRAPSPSLKYVSMSPEDEQDLRNIMPFVLTNQDLDEYYVRYLGRQMADEIPCYVFGVKPKALKPGKRYFSGQIWVDDRDLMVVKSYGRALGLLKKGNDQQFPKFETYREQVDGRYWFPTYTRADSTLHFDSGEKPSLRATVRYNDYKLFSADVRILGAEEVKPENTPPPAPAPAK